MGEPLNETPLSSLSSTVPACADAGVRPGAGKPAPLPNAAAAEGDAVATGEARG